MSVEENKALVRRFYEALNAGEAATLAAMEEFFATDIVEHLGRGDVIHGLKNDKQLEEHSEHKMVVEDMIAEGDKVVARWTLTGTHKATNKRVKMWGITIWRVVGGKIAERWIRYDTLGNQQQLGLLPTWKEKET